MRLLPVLLIGFTFVGCKTDNSSAILEQTEVPPPVAVAQNFEAQKIFLTDETPEAEAVRERMKKGGSMKTGCPVGFDNLTYLKVSHVTFDEGEQAVGELVVHSDHADAIIQVFSTLYADRFPIMSMRLIDDFDANDTRSMDANNTSAFNCRNVTGNKNKWSQHSYGNAIDLNPIQNPYIKGTFVSPTAGKDFTKRDVAKKGMVNASVIAAFEKINWKWGGNWKTPKDYQHFSSNGL